jgi:nucleotide-binding universal stress UspA family protein
MHTQGATSRLVLNRIVHPSDFSPASEVAFAHALKLALLARAELRLMHVAAEVDKRHWSDFPGVRATLARWDLLPAGSPREAVGQLGLDIGKILYPRADPVGALLHYLDAHPAEERMLRGARCPVLAVPAT